MFNLVRSRKGQAKPTIEAGDLVTDGNRIGEVYAITLDPYAVGETDRKAAYVVFADGQFPATEYWYAEDIMKFWPAAERSAEAKRSA
jgi:hypothetical protein